MRTRGVREHSMYFLAGGTLKVAAISGDKVALDIMDDIVGRSEVRGNQMF